MLTCDYYGSVFLRRNISGVNVEELSGRSAAQDRFSVTPNLITNRALIKVNIESPAFVRLDLYAPDGRKVASLLNRHADAGELRFTLDLNSFERQVLSSGAYFVVLKTDNRIITSKVQILR
ncbi:MAG TPA: T9SS type A sorting domain-containing protein [bacterium]